MWHWPACRRCSITSAKSYRSYSPLHLDTNALDEHDLALILPIGQPECIQVFYRINDPQADLYVLDEHNALWHQRLPYHDE